MPVQVNESEFKSPVQVETREGFTIWVKFDDGVAGVVDLSDLAKEPAFASWRDREYFERVRINGYDYLAWGDDEADTEAIIDPDEIYTRLTGLTIEQLYPKWAAEAANRPDLIWPVQVEARDGLSVWIEYNDGEQGLVDLSPMADGPAFSGWSDRAYFETVHINEEIRAIEWGDDLQLCPDALYLDLTGRSWEEVWALPRSETASA